MRVLLVGDTRLLLTGLRYDRTLQLLKTKAYVFDLKAVRKYNKGMEKEKLTASALRKNIYNILDEVIDTGLPATIERKGRVLQIIVLEPPSKLSRLSRREFMVGDPEDFVSMDWSDEWRP